MQELKSKIESLLFVSAKAMSVKNLAELIAVSPSQIEEAGDKLVAELKNSGSGIQIIKNGQNYQMVSSPANTELIQNFVKDETTGELSRPSLETLTIIAYRSPISKFDIDRIRGVNCGMILRNLLLRGLIEAKEDKSKENTYYSVTFDFIRFLGLSDVKDLPNYDKLHADDTIDRVLSGNDNQK
ncbi:MAG: SMC-Scp complex subunit ScpB [bacterium]